MNLQSILNPRFYTIEISRQDPHRILCTPVEFQISTPVPEAIKLCEKWVLKNNQKGPILQVKMGKKYYASKIGKTPNPKKDNTHYTETVHFTKVL